MTIRTTSCGGRGFVIAAHRRTAFVLTAFAVLVLGALGSGCGSSVGSSGGFGQNTADCNLLVPFANVPGGNFEGCTLPLGSSIQSGIFDEANFLDANLNEAIMTPGVSAQCANMTGTWMEFAQMQGIDLRGANLTGANMLGAVLTPDLSGGGPALLNCAILVGADLRYADLSGADLTDVDFTGAFMHNVLLDNADVEGACFDNVSWGPGGSTPALANTTGTPACPAGTSCASPCSVQ